MSEPVTMYTTQWCAFCRRLKSQLARDGIEVAEVDIERDEAAASFVVSVNGGNMTVPTIVFSDGTAMTNPSAAQVKERLRGLAANLWVAGTTGRTLARECAPAAQACPRKERTPVPAPRASTPRTSTPRTRTRRAAAI